MVRSSSFFCAPKVYNFYTRRALFNYSPKTSSVRLETTAKDSGDSIEVMSEDQLSEACLQFAYLATKEPDSHIIKYAMLAWCGESATSPVKAVSQKLEEEFHALLTKRGLPVSAVLHAKNLNDLKMEFKAQHWRLVSSTAAP